MMTRAACLMAALCALAMAAPTGADQGEAKRRIICASTTSTRNSGLFEHILPLFWKESGIAVHVVAVGTGAAIEMGRRGDADVVLVHARDLELRAVEEGYFTHRREIMYNDFVIIGPKDDPIRIKSENTATGAFKKIYLHSHPFVSRGDNSGTHRKELALWRAASLTPHGRWYMETGQGMAKAQRVANEKRAYTLTDRGTWLAKKETLDMAIVLEGGPMLMNQYGVMAVNPRRHGHVKYAEAVEFIDWLASPEGQEAIGALTDREGNRLFIPNAVGIRP